RLNGVGLSLFDAMGITRGPLRDWYGSLMFTNDGAKHDRLRRLVSKAFTPRAAAHVAERLAVLRRAGGGDLVPALAHVPMDVMCALIGVPAAAGEPAGRRSRYHREPDRLHPRDPARQAGRARGASLRSRLAPLARQRDDPLRARHPVRT